MILDNLRLLFGIYRGPARAMGRILDEGSLLFGAIGVLLVGATLTAGAFLPAWFAWKAALEDPARLKAMAERARAGGEAGKDAPSQPKTGQRTLKEVMEEGESDTDPKSLITKVVVSSLTGSVIASLVSLSLLYVPACLFAATQLSPIGSFGVAFRRDYGSLLACT